MLFFKPTAGQHPFLLEGFGYSENIARNSVTPPLVRIQVQVGRHDVIETALDFCERTPLGGPGQVLRSEDCDASVKSEGDFQIPQFATNGIWGTPRSR